METVVEGGGIGIGMNILFYFSFLLYIAFFILVIKLYFRFMKFLKLRIEEMEHKKS